MKRYLFLAGFLFLTIVVGAQNKKTLTTADYDRAVTRLSAGPVAKEFARQNITPQWSEDGRLWYKDPVSDQYVIIDPLAKKTDKILTNKAPEEKRPLNRRRADVKLAVSPDGKKAVFIKNWNLWVKDITTGIEKQLTTDGIENFGYATDNAGWKHSDAPIVLWSPDSRKIATFQQDQRHVKDMYLVRTKVGAPELEQWKYPLPGDSAVIRIHRVIIDVESSAVVRLKMPPDDHRGTLSDDIAVDGELGDAQWSADGRQLAFVSVSRDHKTAVFRLADAGTGAVRTVFKEEVPTQYESGQGMINWQFFPGTDEFIWYSERSGWGHLYLYDLNTGKLKNQITKGDFVVTQLLSADPVKRKIIFEAKGKEPGENPYYSHFYKIDFNGKHLVPLTTEPGTHTVSFSPDGNYFVDRYSAPAIPPVVKLKTGKGKTISELGAVDLGKLKAKGWTAPELFSVRSANGQFDLYGLMYRPAQLDTSKKYPVVVYIYPGPQGGSVGNWSFNPAAGDYQALAELGFIVVRLEGSCNPNRSKAFHDACYGHMGENTLPDQVAGVKQLAAKHPFMDLDRVGIWGHSGGGFATVTALFRYPEFFKAGIAESGNHDNRSYEDDWGERYIGLLEGDNYEKQANQIYAGNLQGKLLLVTGGMDDNVPPYNTYLVADALIKANKTFDLLVLPNARHGYGADGAYVMRRRWDYFVEHLLGATPPKDYKIDVK
ncbi:peptidase S9 [Niabella ginsenosidivorans]|uniref:Peptidase S9 n=1 Tax=Niabella ginsenosidivorans TaxID=1176587 RepID=A0A1A9I4D2_9BACT|nr:S9 family peptidase [Niabella ginsenosidivorans]ANH82175.1 peptidase S9 [Niabella ginsenosidivorans]